MEPNLITVLIRIQTWGEKHPKTATILGISITAAVFGTVGYLDTP